jgi:hypothetical protein
MNKKPEIDTAPPGTRPIRIPQRVELTDLDRLLAALAIRAQRIEDIQRRLGWFQPRTVAAIEAARGQVELHLIESSRCTRYPVGGQEYTHIALRREG